MTVRKSVTVKRPLAVAFSLFTEEIGSWWPLKEGFSFGGERAKEIYLETRHGGRFYERLTDGEEYVVGHVTVCKPPRKIVFTWEDPDWEGPTEVEVRFAAEGNATRVESGASRLGSRAQGKRGRQELRRRLGFRVGQVHRRRMSMIKNAASLATFLSSD